VTDDPIPEELVRRAQHGDTLAMNELLRFLAPYVGRICGPIALHAGADAAQEALIVVFKSLRTLREPAALRGWVRTIAIREAVRIARISSSSVPEDLSTLPALGDELLGTDIHETLATLTPEHRAVLILRDLEGYSEQDTANLLRVPTGTIKSRLHRARESFRKVWTS
jgi:RNA polymerase sigma factor (sigma-70 family)